MDSRLIAGAFAILAITVRLPGATADAELLNNHHTEGNHAVGPRRALEQIDDTGCGCPPEKNNICSLSTGAQFDGPCAATCKGVPEHDLGPCCNNDPNLASAVGGYAACTKVLLACRDGMYDDASIQPRPLCNMELQGMCLSLARSIASSTPNCQSMLQNGIGHCSPGEASAIFESAVQLVCAVMPPGL